MSIVYMKVKPRLMTYSSIDLQWMKPVLKELINNWMKEAIEKEGFEFYQTNNKTNWYKKWAPENDKDGGNHYGYFMYHGVIQYSNVDDWIKISADFTGGFQEENLETLFEGYINNTQDFYKILELIRMK